MEALKAELAKKRKAAEEASSSRPTKYMKRGDLERMKQEEEAALKADSKTKQDEELRAKTAKVIQRSIWSISILTPTLNRLASTIPQRLHHQLRIRRLLNQCHSLMSRMTKQSEDYERKDNLLDCSARRTRIGDCDYALWNL